MFEQVKELLGCPGCGRQAQRAELCKCQGPWRREVIIALTFGTWGRACLSELFWKLPSGVGSQVSWERGPGPSSSCWCSFPPSLPTRKGATWFWFSSAQTCPICAGSFQLRVPLGSSGTLITGMSLTLVLSSMSLLPACWHQEHVGMICVLRSLRAMDWGL